VTMKRTCFFSERPVPQASAWHRCLHPLTVFRSFWSRNTVSYDISSLQTNRGETGCWTRLRSPHRRIIA
jgi:hypothetical protein